MSNFCWATPYRMVKASKIFSLYHIEFDEQILFKNLWYDEAVFVVGALNGAYNLGRQHELLKHELPE